MEKGSRVALIKDYDKKWLERIQKKLLVENGCHIFQGALTSGGYAFGSYRGELMYFHRAMYIVKKGPIPDGQLIRHKCNVRSCLNEEHLETGNSSDNTQDMMKAGRHKHYSKSGEEHWTYKARKEGKLKWQTKT